MKLHKLAEYFPLLQGDEFDLLVQDIKDHGQLEPIVTVNDEILDGVNRWRACEQLGIEPITEAYKGNDPLSYVISLNIRRRHLDVSQRAMLATEMLPEFEAEAAKRQGRKRTSPSADGELEIDNRGWASAARQVSKEFGVSAPTVERAKRVKAQAPEEVEAIIRGEKTVRAVDTELRQKRAKEFATEQKLKQDDKTIKQHPKVVKEYLDAAKTYKGALRLAVAGAERDRFSPESKAFIARWHNDIRSIMSELEGLL